MTRGGKIGMTSELNEIRTRINKALDLMPTEVAEQRLRAHLEWEAREMIAHIPPDKMTASELAAIIAVLHMAHARVLMAPTGGRPTLRVIPREDSAEVLESIG
jgi:hypothetical protein